jgi:hypothetical protein
MLPAQLALDASDVHARERSLDDPRWAVSLRFEQSDRGCQRDPIDAGGQPDAGKPP